MFNDELPRLHLHVNYLSQLQCINRRRLHDFDVLARKRLTRGAGAVRVAEIEAAYAEDVIRAHLGALIEDKNDLLAEWFRLKTYTDGHTPLICSNRPTLQMNTMTFDMDGVCTVGSSCYCNCLCHCNYHRSHNNIESFHGKFLIIRN